MQESLVDFLGRSKPCFLNITARSYCSEEEEWRLFVENLSGLENEI
jgi:hypothetical protein